MKKLTIFFKRLRLRQILTVFLAGMLLIASTACSGANTQGANPSNPAVQAGGANNPHKSGGDSYTKLKMSTDPKVNTTKANERNQAILPLDSAQMLAASKESEMLYPGAETPAGRAQKEAEFPIKSSKDFSQPEPGGLNQRNPILGERIENRIEEATDAFKESASFVQEKAGEAGQRPELQSNPALHK